MLITTLVVLDSPSLLSADVLRQAIAVRADRALRIELDLRVGRITLLPGPAADSVFVTVRHFDPDEPPRIHYSEEASRLRIRYRAGGWDSERWRRNPEVTLSLPADVEMLLRCKLRAGELFAELGGLKLREAELSIWAGEVEIEFSEPNRIPMTFFGLNAFVGETVVRQLGNARFEEAVINAGIGDLRLDFEGSLLELSRVEVDLDIGETRIRIPRSVGVRVSASKVWLLSAVDIPRSFEREGRFYFSPNYRGAKKELRLRLKPGIGSAKLVFR